MMAKRKALGKGLGALIQDVEKTGDNFILCPIGEISPSRVQPRKDFHEQQLQELADSIREKGVIEPLIVRRSENGYELIAGERRWRASKLAGLKEVPVIVRDASEEESLELAIIENIQRADLNPIEEALAYKNLMEKFELSQDDVAKKVGRERATVANYLRLLKLAPEVKDELQKGTISMGHAKVLLSLDTHAVQRELCRKIIRKGLSVRATEDAVSHSVKGGKKEKGFERNKTSHQLKSVEDELRTIFGTKILLKEKKGKGRLEIEFYSYEELERLLEMMRGIKG
ncbi:MAG: ParB/RepB/Spo0J family partition protein [Deltaproteobacteria bacterium]|nr:ParB/RepB/Spo0J family partition protein [Deltaproteobacteria bacterium]MBI3754564.1 ParB/RepB/Spo0J family partition protein [Deltaproteobacteria bacterium]